MSQDGERRLYGRLLRMFIDWLKRVLDRVLAAWRRFGTTPDPNGVYEESQWWEREVERLVDEDLTDIAREQWERTAADLGIELPFVSHDSFLQAQFAITQNLLVRIPDEVYNLIFAEINDGVNEGEDPDEITARVQRSLDVTGSEDWPNRARVIAVTEANRAGHAASLAVGFEAQALEGVPMDKVWLDSDDRRVRPTHAEADGQRVPLEQPFIVGGFPLMFPSDPLGPPQEVIFCRCDIQIVERTDA